MRDETLRRRHWARPFTEAGVQAAIRKADSAAALIGEPWHVFSNGRELWTASESSRAQLWPKLAPVYSATPAHAWTRECSCGARFTDGITAGDHETETGHRTEWIA